MRLLGFAAILVLVGRLSAQTYCTPTTPDPNGGNGLSLPSLPETYQTRIEMNKVDEEVTLDIEEYFDSTGNRARMNLKVSDSTTFFVFSYETNELFMGSLDTMTCDTTNLTGDPDNFFFGVRSDDGQAQIFTSSGALRFGSKYGEKYIGKDVVRGISVDHWQSCVEMKSLKASFIVDYYFTATNWTAPFVKQQVPVRAWVHGGPINHYYDYFSFIENVKDPTVFETPAGIVCPNRVVTLDVPLLAGQYSYREEIINPLDGSVTLADVWFDTSYKLDRYDFRNYEPTAPFYSLNPMTQIHDYNTGVSYVIDKVDGNCTIQPIERTGFDVSVKYSKERQYTDRMKSSLGLFYLDETYSYEGQRTYSGMLCDVFVSRRTDFPVDGPDSPPVNVTFEYYFLSNDWTEVAQSGLDEDTAIPVHLEISSFDSGYSALYNFYDFDQEHPDLNNFDVTPCFDDTSTINIEVKFPGKFDPDVRENVKYFELNTRLKIAELSDVSPIRVQRSAVKHTGQSILYYAMLLDHSPASAKFHKYSGMVLANNNDKSVDDIISEDDCAYMCLQETTFDCLSFDLCPQKRKCYLSKTSAADGTLTPSGVCSHYARNVAIDTVNEIELADGYAQLKNNVYRNMLSIILPLGNGESTTFVASGIRQDIISPDQASNQQITGENTIQQFYPLRNFMFLGNADDILTGVSVDECATSCVTEDLFVCQSFEYNFNNGECQLSSRHPMENRRFVRRSDITDLYIRTYTYKFKKYPGTVFLGKSDMVYQKIRYSSQCAKLCVDLNEFPCKSFEFCSDERVCILGRTHMLDTPVGDVQTDASCDHYSRSYMDDFKKISGTAIALTNNYIIEGITLLECAKMCADEGDTCMGFDFCGNDTFCRITSDSVKNVGQVTVQATSYCDHYTRQYYTDGSKVTGYSLKNGQDPSLKYSSGSMTALAFGCLFLGCLLTMGIAYGIIKFRPTSVPAKS